MVLCYQKFLTLNGCQQTQTLSLNNTARCHITSHQPLKQGEVTSNPFFYTFKTVRKKLAKKAQKNGVCVCEWGEYKKIYEVCYYTRLHYIEIQALHYLEIHMHRMKY